MMKHNLSVVLGAFLLALALFGCGGGGSAPQTGRATVSVTWPAATTRLIPFASSSIRVLVTQGAQGVGEAILARPASGGTASATFDRLPTGSVTVTATAYPDPNASGVAQAAGSAPVTIVKGQVASLNLTLASTITEATVSPVAASVAVGGDTKLAVSFRNAQSQVVIVALATTQWTSRTPAVATVDAAGRVVGVAAGTAIIEAKDTESGKVGLAELTVTSSSGGGGGGSTTATYNPANGHYYEVVRFAAGITWPDAKAAAEARGGYLASITDGAENTFVFNLASNVANWYNNGASLLGPWLGGYRETDTGGPNANWKWVSSEAWGYTNWAGNQPDNAGGGENKLHFFARFSSTPTATWNDMPGTPTSPGNNNPIAYIIEWNTNPGGGGGGGTGSFSEDPALGGQPSPYSGSPKTSAITFLAPVSYTGVNKPSNTQAADIDGDGNSDVIIGSSAGIYVLYGRGNGTLENPVLVFSKVDGAIPWGTVDMNGDGRLDIVATDGLDKVHVIPNLGGRSFADSQFTTYGTRVDYSAAIADFNGDNKKDVLLGKNRQIDVFLNDGTGPLKRGATINVADTVGGIACGDLNADGKIDAVVTYNTSVVNNSGFQFIQGNGDGTFTAKTTYKTGTSTILFPIILDANRDGKWDVGVSNFHDSRVSIALGNSDGTFQTPTSYSMPAWPGSTRVADFNKDNYPDIVAPLAGFPGVPDGGQDFAILQNKGTGIFLDRVIYPAGGRNVGYPAVADLNKDGKLDVICSCPATNTITVSLNTTP